jgi:hypothetical protein
MDELKNLADAQASAGAGKTLSPRGRFAVAVVFSIISACLAIVMVDRAYTEAMIFLGKKSATAAVTKVVETKSRSVYSYWVSYSFEVGDRNYERSSMFGLMRQGTKIMSSDRSAYTEGASVEVLYSSLNPGVNEPVKDPYRNDKSIFILIGALLFGFIAFNEFKSLRKKK